MEGIDLTPGCLSTHIPPFFWTPSSLWGHTRKRHSIATNQWRENAHHEKVDSTSWEDSAPETSNSDHNGLQRMVFTIDHLCQYHWFKYVCIITKPRRPEKKSHHYWPQTDFDDDWQWVIIWIFTDISDYLDNKTSSKMLLTVASHKIPQSVRNPPPRPLRSPVQDQHHQYLQFYATLHHQHHPYHCLYTILHHQHHPYHCLYAIVHHFTSPTSSSPVDDWKLRYNHLS